MVRRRFEARSDAGWSRGGGEGETAVILRRVEARGEASEGWESKKS